MATKTLSDLMSNTFKGEIVEGKHAAMIVHWEYIQNETDATKDYLRVDFMIDGDREYTRNFFVKDVSIMLSQIRRQLDRANDDLNPVEFLNELVTQKTALEIWFKYRVVPTRNGLARRQNVHFIGPVELPTNDKATAETSDELPPMDES